MADVKITASPKQAVTGLKWTRSGNKYTLSWTIPSNLTAGTNNRRATWFEVRIRLEGKYGARVIANNTNVQKGTSYSLTLEAKDVEHYEKIIGSVLSCNKFWSDVYRRDIPGNYPSNEVPLAIKPPRTASWGSATWDATNAKVSCTFTGTKAEQEYPRSNYYWLLWRNGRINGESFNAKVFDGWNLGSDTNNTLSYTVAHGESDKLVRDDDYILLHWSVRPYGLKGYASRSHRYLNIAKPAKPTIKTITKSNSGNGLNVTIDYDQKLTTLNQGDFNNGSFYWNPVETAQMYIAYAEKKGQIEDSDWTAIGDEIATWGKGFFLNDADITPEVGQHVFLKCRTNYQIYSTESGIVQVDDKFYFTNESGQGDAPTATVAVVDKWAGEDNTSVYAVIGYGESDVFNACEISYSTDTNGWESTKQPESYQMKDTLWQDSTSKSTTHKYTSTIKISELDEGTKYYLRARRYNTTNEDERTLWSKRVEQSTSQDELTGLVLTASDVVATNKLASFSWEFPGDLKQTKWFLYNADTKKEIEHGEGTVTMVSHSFDTAGTYNVYVQSFFEDGRDMKSENVAVQVMDAPTLTFTTLPTKPLTALPQTFTITADQADADIQVKVLSQGIVNSMPDGTSQQYRNDVVYSAEGAGEVTCTIEDDDGKNLWNNGTYRIEAVASANGVKSDTYWTEFDVKYTDTVSAPEEDDVFIMPNENKGVRIQVNNLADGLTWDLYRATKDERNFLIAQDLNSGTVIQDDFAPFCSKTDCEYIVLAKNAQGQYDYRYYPYTANAHVLRFDWNNKFVELPYNIEISDETDKQFEQQVYLDGTQKGAWGASVIRSSSLSTDTIYVEDEETQRLIRDLGRYQGAVFVRTPLGQAYTANVEVNEISKTYDSKVMAVSFDCTEIDLTNPFGAKQVENLFEPSDREIVEL